MKNFPFAIVAALSLAAGPALAVTLVQDGFGTAGALAGRTPDTVGATPWTANANYSTNGTTASYNHPDVFAAGMGSIDLGSGYFASHAGTYQLTMDITYVANASPSTGVWGVGFSADSSTLDAITLASGGTSTQLGQPWIFLRENGTATVRNNSSSVNLYTTTAGAYPSGATHTLKIVLDTSTAIWTFATFVDNVALGTTTAIGATNPNLRYIAITSTTNLGAIDNFKLDFTPIPEPSAFALIGLGTIGFSLLRKRKI